MRLFISYAHNDKRIVEMLTDDLEKLGHDVWFDEALAGSEKWWQRILDEIEACEVFIYAVSPDAIDSPACRTEYQYASDLNKPTLPVMLKDAELIGGLREIQFVDARKLNSRDTALALGRSLGHIQREILEGTHDAPAQKPPRPSFPFPEDPLTAYRERIHNLRDVPESDLLLMVYELKQLGRSGARTAREVRDLLHQMYHSPHIPRGVMSEIQDALNALPQPGDSNRLLQVMGLLGVFVAVVAVAYFTVLRDEGGPTDSTLQPAASESAESIAAQSTLRDVEMTATYVIQMATETQAAIDALAISETSTPDTSAPPVGQSDLTATQVMMDATQTQAAIETAAAVTPSPTPTEVITSVTGADITRADDLFSCEGIITNADASDGRNTILVRVMPGAEAVGWDTFSEEQLIQVLAQQPDDEGVIWYLAARFMDDLAWVAGWIRGEIVFLYEGCQPPRFSDAIFEQLGPPVTFGCAATVFEQPEANVYTTVEEDVFILKIPPEAETEVLAQVAGPNRRLWYNLRARLNNASVQGWLPSTAVQVDEGCQAPDFQQP